MKWPKPDGNIEMLPSGCCCPPGLKANGQHTNSSTSWWRIKEGEWTKIDRGVGGAFTLAECANSCEEFAEAMKG